MRLVGKKFKELLSEKSRINNSRLILALDVSDEDIVDESLERRSLDILEKTSNSIVAVKVGYSLVLRVGLEILSKIKETGSVPIIADFKIADVPHISQQIARYAYGKGADAVIAHGFTGRDSLEAVIRAAGEADGRGVFVVSNMSHPGGQMFIRPSADKILDLAREARATGVIGPATRPEEVTELRSKAGEEMLILTPGIGAQGARAGDAIRSGADYEIVGRAIYNSKSPETSASKIRREINETIEEKENE